MKTEIKVMTKIEYLVDLIERIRKSGQSSRVWGLERGIDPATLSRVMNGLRSPTEDFIRRTGGEVRYIVARLDKTP